MSLSFEGQNLPANQISLTYLNPRLIYNYFRFGNTDVRHIRILFFDCNFNNSRRAILHQSTKFRTNRVTRSGVMTSYTFSRWRHRRLHTTFGFAFDDVTLNRTSKAVRKPNFVDVS